MHLVGHSQIWASQDRGQLLTNHGCKLVVMDMGMLELVHIHKIIFSCQVANALTWIGGDNTVVGIKAHKDSFLCCARILKGSDCQ